MKSIHNTPAAVGRNRYGRPFASLDPKAQAVVILDFFGTTHKTRAKDVGALTKKARALLLFQVIEELSQAGYHLRTLQSLDQRHITALLHGWLDRGLSSSTLQNRLCGLRWIVGVLGKGGMIRHPSYYGLPEERLRRTYVAATDKSWSSRVDDFQALIGKAAELDQWVGMHLQLMHQFGLRMNESIMIRPRESWVGQTLKIEEGTKGGRTRVVDVRTDAQVEALKKATEFSKMDRKGGLVPPDKTPAQARRRIYYVCSKVGITRSQLEITPHGLRHQYANDLYQEISGTPSVVRGSSRILDAEAEAKARAAVSRELGHKRLSITGAYTGPDKSALARRLPSRPPQSKHAS